MKRIRLATHQDVPRMLEIYAPSIANSHISFEIEVPSLHDFGARFAEYSAQFSWLVCEENARVLGYAYASPHRARAAYAWSVESSVFVDSQLRRQGVASQLNRSLFALLKSQGVANVFAGIGLPNEPSVRLHESLGFNLVGIYRDIGFKLNRWWDVGWWQLPLQKPTPARPLLAPVTEFTSDF